MREFDVLLLCETRTDFVPDSLLPDHSIAFCPASRAGQAGEGMAVAVRKSHAYHIQDWASDDTSLWVRLAFPSGARPIVVGTCYVPPAGSHNLQHDDCNSRFAKLAAHLVAAQAEGHVLLAGDFNARVGSLGTPACALQQEQADNMRNQHGRCLLNLCSSTSTLLCTGRAPGDEAAPLSFTAHGGGGGSRIDHILVSPSLMEYMQLCKVNSLRLESDHYPIECELHMPAVSQPVPPCSGAPLSRRHWDPDARNAYCHALQTPKCAAELHAAQQSAQDHDVPAAFSHLLDAIGLAANDAGMPSRHGSHRVVGSPSTPFFDSECRESKRRVRSAQDSTTKKVLEREYHSLVRSKRRAYRLGRLRALLVQQHTQPRHFWKLLRSAQTPIPVSLQPVQTWDHFLENLAGCSQGHISDIPLAAYPQQPLQPAACLNAAISVEEVGIALVGLHNGRAKGMQGLPSELLRYAQLESTPGGPPPVNILAPILAKVLNAAFQGGIVPSAVNGSLITPVFKKGDPLCTGNYRPIAVTEPAMRLYANILSARLVKFTEDNNLRAQSQSGFRPKLSTLHSVFALQHFVDKAKADGDQLYTCFLDLKSAYDSVQRPLLWQVLQRLGVHGSMLAALQSLYRDSVLTININGRCGKSVQSHIGVKQGCPLSPTLFGLYIDGMHRFLMSSGPLDVPSLSSGVCVPDLAYADDVALMAKSPQGLQRLIDLVCDFCGFMGMTVSVIKTKVLVFNTAFPGPLQWSCGGQQLEIVVDFKYLGLIFTALHGLAATFPLLKRNMFGAWALIKRQYGRLQCLASVGLMLTAYEGCVPPTAAYGCEVWGFQQFPQQYSALRLELATSHLQMLKEIAGVRSSTPTDILFAELGLQPIQHVWLLRAAKFWNSLACKPATSIYKVMALDCCSAAVSLSRHNWAWSMFRAIRATGYELCIRADDMDMIDVGALKQHLARQQSAAWDGLDVSPRTCPSPKSRHCTYLRWFARPSGKSARTLLDIPVSATCMKGLLRFRMGVHRLPRDEGAWVRPHIPRLERICQLCATNTVGDERHLVFECQGLQCFREKWSHLFQGQYTMQAFLWQDDLIGVAKFINACLQQTLTRSNI